MGTMTYKFLSQPLDQGRYEPEGIYLTLPLEGQCIVVQAWGEHSDFYGTYTYNNVPLKGHNGIDIQASANADVLAVDAGRIISIGIESPGWGRYIKLEHTWGESLYAHLGQISVASGQLINRSSKIGTVEPLLKTTVSRNMLSFLHFGIRIKPYNRFDGWGGFVDPTPYLPPNQLSFQLGEDSSNLEVAPISKLPSFSPHVMVIEGNQTRRP